jgi:AcrR family transcriptional regulator
MTAERESCDSSANGSSAATRGRPRSLEVDAAIFSAGWAVLSEVGYGGLTFEAVAQRAGCNRPALYRRFGSKRELVIALVLSLVRQIEPKPAVDNPRQDLIGHLRGFIQYLTGPGGGAMLGLAQARREDPELSKALDRLFENERPFYVESLEQAVGTALPQAFCHLLIDAMLGAVAFRVLFRDGDLSAAEIEELIDQAISAAAKGPLTDI